MSEGKVNLVFDVDDRLKLPSDLGDQLEPFRAAVDLNPEPVAAAQFDIARCSEIDEDLFSLVFNETRARAQEAVPHEFDLAPCLWEVRQRLEYRLERALAQRPTQTNDLAQYLNRIDQPRGPAPGGKSQPGCKTGER